MTLVMDMPDIVCVGCRAPIGVGEPYSQELVAVGDRPGADDNELVMIVCPTCGDRT